MARNITVIPAKQILTAESGTAQSVQKLKMAAYCRVSTDQEEQLLSYENQVNYYTNYISENPLYEYAGTAKPLDFLLVNLSAPECFSAVRANQHSA